MTRLEELSMQLRGMALMHGMSADFPIIAEFDTDVQALIAEARRECLEKAADLCEVMAGEAISEGETDVAYHDTMIVARDQIRALLPEVKE